MYLKMIQKNGVGAVLSLKLGAILKISICITWFDTFLWPENPQWNNKIFRDCKGNRSTDTLFHRVTPVAWRAHLCLSKTLVECSMSAWNWRIGGFFQRKWKTTGLGDYRIYPTLLVTWAPSSFVQFFFKEMRTTNNKAWVGSLNHFKQKLWHSRVPAHQWSCMV